MYKIGLHCGACALRYGTSILYLESCGDLRCSHFVLEEIWIGSLDVVWTCLVILTCLRSFEERKLISDAAMTLALSGSANRHLCRQLGQNSGPPRIKFELLSEHQLPLPMLALMNHDQMVENSELLDKAFPRNPKMHAQRLIMAFDHTYLLKSMQQIQFGGRRGLVGGPWLRNNSSQAWIPLDEDEGQLFKTKTEKAGLMLEILVWDANAAKKRCVSFCSMPMTLGMRSSSNEDETEQHAGNWATGPNIVQCSKMPKVFISFYIYLYFFIFIFYIYIFIYIY